MRIVMNMNAASELKLIIFENPVRIMMPRLTQEQANQVINNANPFKPTMGVWGFFLLL